MVRRIAVCLVSLVLSAPVWAQDPASPPAQGSSDMSQMGPWTRKPTNEAKTRKEIEAFFKEEDALMQKGDFEGTLARIDFPYFMVTDDSKGVPMAQPYDREQYTAMMKPMFEQMPKDTKVKHKHTITVLSDSLATFTDDFTMTMGGKKLNGRSGGLLVKRDGQWKWKTYFEAGWGDDPSGTAGGSGTPGGQEKPKK